MMGTFQLRISMFDCVAPQVFLRRAESVVEFFEIEIYSVECHKGKLH